MIGEVLLLHSSVWWGLTSLTLLEVTVLRRLSLSSTLGHCKPVAHMSLNNTVSLPEVLSEAR